jgi:hypothetical protein
MIHRVASSLSAVLRIAQELRGFRGSRAVIEAKLSGAKAVCFELPQHSKTGADKLPGTRQEDIGNA